MKLIASLKKRLAALGAVIVRAMSNCGADCDGIPLPEYLFSDFM